MGKLLADPGMLLADLGSMPERSLAELTSTTHQELTTIDTINDKPNKVICTQLSNVQELVGKLLADLGSMREESLASAAFESASAAAHGMELSQYLDKMACNR